MFFCSCNRKRDPGAGLIRGVGRIVPICFSPSPSPQWRDLGGSRGYAFGAWCLPCSGSTGRDHIHRRVRGRIRLRWARRSRKAAMVAWGSGWEKGHHLLSTADAVLYLCHSFVTNCPVLYQEVTSFRPESARRDFELYLCDKNSRHPSQAHCKRHIVTHTLNLP